jgi:hypothetical protein
MNDPNKYPPHKEQVFMREEDLQLPAQLNDNSVAAHLEMVSRRAPEQLPRTVRAIREKWAYSVGGWAERGRLDYLETVLKGLRVSNEILAECVEMDQTISRHGFEKQEGIAKLEAQAKAEEIRVRIANAQALQATARRKRQEADATLPAEKREMTPEERRKENLRRAEDKVSRLRDRMNNHLGEILQGRRFEQLSADEQDEYRADENSYRDRLRRAKEELIDLE